MYNFECDWLIELSDNYLESELVEFFTPIAIVEIVIFMVFPLVKCGTVINQPDQV